MDRYANDSTEDELRAHLAAIVNCSKDAIISSDPDGLIITWNAGAERLFGYTAEEVLRQPVSLLLPIGQADEFPAIVERLRSGKHVDHYESVRKTKDGRRLAVSICISPVRDSRGKFVGVSMVGRDITERARTEQALRAAEQQQRRSSEQFEALFNHVPVGAYLIDADFRIRRVNSLGQPVFSDFPGGVIGRDFEEVLQAIWGDRAEEFVPIFRHTLATGEPYHSPEFAGLRVDRKVTEYYDWRIERIRLPDGQYGVLCYFRDISEQVHARRAIAASEERYRTLFENLRASEERLRLAKAAAGLGIHDYDVATGAIGWDERTRAIWGVGEDEPINYEVWLSGVHPADRESAQAAVKRAIDPGGNGVYLVEYRVINRNDGITRWVEVTGHTTFRDGRPMRLVGTVQETTERKATEEQLRRNHDTFFRLIENSPFGVYIIDSEFRLRQVSAGARKVFENVHPLLGRKFDEVLRSIWGEPFASDAIARFRHTLDTGAPYIARDTTEQRQDIAAVESYDWRIERITLPDGQFGVVCYFYDLSEIKQAEAEIRKRVDEAEEGRRILQAIMEHVPEGITVADAPDVTIRMVSRHGIELAGRSAESLTGAPASVHPDSWGIYQVDGKTRARPEQLPLTRAVQHGEKVINEEWLLRRPDGSSIPILCSAGPIRDQQGTVLGGIIAWRDITEHKRTEEELKLAARRKDEFLATLAHELRNPLAAIRMALSVMGNASDAQMVDMMAIIERQSAQLVRLIDDLLDVSRISRGMIELKKSYLDVAEVVHQVLQTSGALFDEKGLSVTVSLPEQPVAVHADPVRFEQVVTNLLNNACKFTNRGGRIRVSIEADGDQAMVRVSDTGIGMPREELPRIFDMFAQISGPGSHQAGGLGIGLSLVRSIVSLHGGTVEARSGGPGKGSEFIVRMPMAAGETLEIPAGREVSDPSPPQPPVPPQRIVAADDNGDALEAVAQLLRMKGYDVETAANGAEALEKVRQLRPDVVLLDIGMPGMSGYEVARQIRLEPWGRAIRLVAMTGWGQERDKQQAHAAGFDTHLTKPVDPALLAQVLSRQV